MNILFACSAGINRSKAFASIFKGNVMYVGVDNIPQKDLDTFGKWATRIYVFETRHCKFFEKYKSKVVNLRLPDIFLNIRNKLVEEE